MTEPIHNGQQNPDPVDLEIRIATPWGSQGQRLDFVLNSPSGVLSLHQKTVPGKVIHAPDSFQAKLLSQLNSLNQGKDVDGQPLLQAELPAELISIGRDLYRALIPQELSRIYQRNRDKIRTLLITTDEPWIPWEILHPDQRDDDDFLCMKHQISRWLTGDVSLVKHRPVRRLLCIESGAKKDLKKAAKEVEFLEKFVRRTKGLEPSIHPRAGFKTVTEALERESFDFLHFAGHGQHDSERPAEAKILLEEGAFRARHVSAVAERKLRQERPMVFFNGCEVGRMDQALTEQDGWAQRWVQRCGCSAFLAPAWSVRDASALAFAKAFYESLAAGFTLGAAVLQARRILRREKPGDTAWLAYRLYGPPNAKVYFGGQVPELPAIFEEEAESWKIPHRVGHPSTYGSPEAWSPSGTASPLRGPATGRSTGQRSPAPRGRAAGIGAAAIVGVLSLGWWLNGLGTAEEPRPESSVPVQEKETLLPLDATEKEPLAATGSGGAEVVVREKAVAPAPSPPPPGPPASEPKSAIPLSPQVAGKIATFAFDGGKQQTDFQIASAVKSALFELGSKATIVIPPVDSTFEQQLARGSLPAWSTDDGVPWGAEYLLIATASVRSLPQSPSHIKSVALTLSSELIRTRDGASIARAQESHTGTDISISGALTQAATRCLRPISDYLNQGES